MNENLLESLRSKYPNTTNDFNNALQDVITGETFSKTPSSNPIITILGAQPGAGKTELQNITQRELKDNVVVCNADNFRDYYPNSEEIKKNYPKEYPHITGEFAHKLNRGLQEHCVKNSLSYILEATFKDTNSILNTIEILKENNYQVDVKLLAVDGKISRLYTEKRYEDMFQNEGVGRSVIKKEHDIRDNALNSTVKAVVDANKFDNISIYKRDIKEKDGIKHSGVSLVEKNPVNPLKTFLEERTKPLDKDQKVFYKNVAEKVLDQKQERKAPALEISAFKMEFSQVLNPKIDNKLKL